MRIAWLQKQSLFLLLIALVAGGAALPGYAQQKLLPLRLDLVSISLNKLVNWVALEEGLYRKNGLDVQQFMPLDTVAEVKKFTGYEVPPPYVRGGGAGMIPDKRNPITIGGGSPNIVAMVTNARAVKTVIILTTENTTRWLIIARKDITKPEQLKGKRLGYTTYGTTSHFQATLLAKRMGWDPIQDISLLSTSGAADLSVLRDGVADAFVSGELATLEALAAGYKPLVDMGEWKVPMASNGVNVDRAWLQGNRETARRLVKSIVEAIALMKKDKQIAFRAMAKYYGITDPKMQAYFYEEMPNVPRKPYPTVAGVQKTMEVFESVAGNEMRKHKPEEFYDDSFVRELDQSGFIDSLYK